MKPELVSEKPGHTPVRAGDWICMRMERMKDGRKQPCFNHLYSHPECRRHGRPYVSAGLNLDQTQALQTVQMILRANSELHNKY